ncbi:hypothetical protein KR054_005097 [Drosophila jambulina]|nr:hypothetical protein KR054_005097 [Drosophila jambulina]
MLKGLVLVLGLFAVQAAVIRNEGNPGPDPLFPETTTAAVILDQQEEGVTTTEESTTLAALSRDEEASILIDPAPGTLQEDAPSTVQKSGKLLLLSTPPKRHHEIERELEEQDEDEDKAGDEPTTTEQPKDNEKEQQKQEEQQQEKAQEKEEEASATTESSTTPATTRLFAIDATPAEKDSPPANFAISLSQDNATISIVEQPQVPGDNNAAVELALVEPEAEYVLLDDSEVHDELDLQLGSFTHIDSDVRLQPVVHSVEIVPTSLDDPLIVNYVHNLR